MADWLLFVVAAVTLCAASCRDAAADRPREDGGAGDALQQDGNSDGSGTDLDGGMPADAGDVDPAPTGTVTVSVGDETLIMTARSECVGGHQLFTAAEGEHRLFVSVFINRAGVYRCADPAPYIFVQYRGPITGEPTADPDPNDPAGNAFFIADGTGPGYAFNASGGGSGDCIVDVTERRPRFKATFSGSLGLVLGKGPPVVSLQAGQIDVGTPLTGCLE